VYKLDEVKDVFRKNETELKFSTKNGPLKLSRIHQF